MKKILILSPYPEGVAGGQRLKYEQYYDSWEKQGYSLTKSSFFDNKTWDILWKKGFLLSKIHGTCMGYLRRIRDVARLRKYEIVYIFMWGTPLGLPFFEWIVSIMGKKIIYDLDDFVFNSSDYLPLLKGGYKCRFLIRHSHNVIVSSPFSINYCEKNNKFSNVQYIPCSLDLERFRLKKREWSQKIVLGWTGTFSSKPYLDSIKDVFYEVAKNMDIKIILITNFDYSLEGLDYENVTWKESSEIEDLHRIDIGLYPLINSEWALGKGGLKALQYMATGIPAIATNFGTVKDFITHKENGFLVDTTKQWVDAIITVAENAELRKKIIMNARNTVEKSYSVSSNKKKYLNIFEEISKELD